MKKQESLTIIKKLTNELKKADFIQAIYGIGSISGNYFDEYSDVDLVVLVNKEIGKKDVLPYVKEYEIIYEGREFPYRIDISLERLNIMLFFGSYDWIVKKMVNKLNKIDFSKIETYRDFIRLKRAKIFFDKRNLLRNFQEKIKEYPKGMKEYLIKERFEKLNYYLFLDDGALNVERKRGNILEITPLISNIVFKIYEIVFAINDKFLVDRKWIYKEINSLRKKPKNIDKKIKKVFNLGNSNKNVDIKVKILRDISLELMELSKKEKIKYLPNLIRR